MSDIEENAPSHVLEQLATKSWGELEVLEHAGYLLFPTEIYRRKRNGEFDKIPVCLRVPRPKELREARVYARKVAQEEGLDLNADEDLISEIETVCLLSKCIRNNTMPHEPWVTDPSELESSYDKVSLSQAWDNLNKLSDAINPAPSSLSEDEMFVLLAAIAKERNILPLAVCASDAQTSFIVTMACQLMSYLEPKSSSESSEPSTLEH